MANIQDKLQEKELNKANNILAFSSLDDCSIELAEEEAKIWKDFAISELEQEAYK